MRYKIKLNGRETVSGTTSEEVVEALATYQWADDTGTKQQAGLYMNDVSQRLKTQTGEVIRVCCAEHFLEDLVRAGSIERVE